MMEINSLIIENASDLLKALSEPSRLTIVYLLSLGELNVSSLADKLNKQQSAVSHQLKILKAARLVKFKKEGKSRIYSLADEHIYEIIDQVFTHIQEKEN